MDAPTGARAERLRSVDCPVPSGLLCLVAEERAVVAARGVTVADRAVDAARGVTAAARAVVVVVCAAARGVATRAGIISVFALCSLLSALCCGKAAPRGVAPSVGAQTTAATKTAKIRFMSMAFILSHLRRWGKRKFYD